LGHAKAALDERLGGATHEAVRTGWPVAVEAALALDRRDEAASLLEKIERLPPGHVAPMVRAELHRYRARVPAASKRSEKVEDDLQAAVADYEDLGYPYLLAQARADFGEWLLESDRRPEAVTALESAADTFQRLGYVPAIEPRRALRACVRGAL